MIFCERLNGNKGMVEFVPHDSIHTPRIEAKQDIQTSPTTVRSCIQRSSLNNDLESDDVLT